MNVTEKETPSNSQKIIKKNDLLQAAKLVTREDRQELKRGGDFISSTRRQGKGSFHGSQTARLAPPASEVCRKLRQARVLLFAQQGWQEHTQPRSHG